MTHSFTGQVALVTGAGAGIGRAIAMLLAARGAHVIVADPGSDVIDGDSVSRAERTVEDIRALGGNAIADLTASGTAEGARHLAEIAQKSFRRLDVLINNAGVAAPGPIDTVSDDDIDRVMSVNLLGPYHLIRAMWPMMKAYGYGRIVNMCSSAALGSGISGPYAVSKAGLIGLTKEAAIAGRDLGIRVNAILPTASTMLLDNHPDVALREWVHSNFPAERVAAVAAFLAGRDVPCSGEMFLAAGGHVARLGFVLANGYLDRDLTPEGVEAHFHDIMRVDGGAPISDQTDVQSVLATLFPRA
ncbi:MAG: SDR family oxidoreductase [Asticcacaulis sp.]|nr:SDR family oxidoreductase [Asticcacaulis sp.]